MTPATVLARIVEMLSVRQMRQAQLPAERAMKRGILAAWKLQQRAVFEALNLVRESDAQIVDGVLVQTLPSVEAQLVGPATKALVAGANRLNIGLNLKADFGLSNPRAVEFQRRFGADRVTRINDTTRDGIRQLLVKSAELGWSPQKLGREIRNHFAGFDGRVGQKHLRNRAELVATTETRFAYEAGQSAMAAQMAEQGLPMEKRWVTVGDSRVSLGCVSNQSQGWIPAEASWGNAAQPPRFPGCRCHAQYQVAG